MTDTCRNGLHPKVQPGRCVPCHEARQRRYRQTDKGRAQHRRSNARYEATYKGGASRIERNLRVDAKRHREVEELHGIR